MPDVEPEVTATPAEVTTENGDTDTPVQKTEETEGKAEVKTEPTEPVKPESDAASDPAPKPKKGKADRKIADLSYQVREQRRAIERLVKNQEKSGTQEPDIAQFENMGDYLKAFNAWERNSQAPKTEQTSDQREYEHSFQASKEDLFEAGSDKYEDFEEVVLSHENFTEVMSEALFEMDDLETQSDVAYYLGKNKKVAARIAKLSPLRQATEMGKLEGKILSKPKSKRPSTAPEPIKPVGGSKTSSDEIQGVEKFEDFLKKRNKQLGRK